MVAALHAAGLEVILDVVFNHTAETDELGPTLSFRGLDNAAYYRLQEDDRRFYVNDAGCGNVLATAHPRVLQLVTDALRHWATLGVDGFRFDLAPILGRGRDGGFTAEAPLLQAIRQDPVLGGLKLVAEPWDIGPGGYQLGRFPPPFAEWNDRFRDCVRRFWRGDAAILPELAGRLLGSAELFEASGRGGHTSVNFVAAHDGFTLADTVSYAERHNAANGEANRDGHAHNFSANHGVEGPSEDPAIGELRRRQVRNMLVTLFLARGTPMLAMGDEALRSQGGNNNAYCQDNEISWYDWKGLTEHADELIGFVGRLAALRRTALRPLAGRFLHGRAVDAQGLADVLWLTPGGAVMGEEHWHRPDGRSLVLALNSRAWGEPAARVVLACLHAGAAPLTLTLPALPGILGWSAVLATTAGASADGRRRAPGETVEVAARSCSVWADR
jgi:glycogen operon protein